MLRSIVFAAGIGLLGNACMLPVLLLRHDVTEKLDKPVPVQGWSKDGLALADGRTVKLPGFKSLPEDSSLLKEATAYGVEVDRSGRVVALVRVWHWCGTDIIRRHVARVDLANALIYFDQGERTFTVASGTRMEPESKGKPFIGKNGWVMSDYHAFKDWESANRKELRKHLEAQN